jgi:hypothetical protein
MSWKTVLVVTLCAAVLTTPAWAEAPVRGTIGLYLSTDEGNDLSRSGVTKAGEPFELVVRIDAEIPGNAIVFQITELSLLYPGVFKVSTWRYDDSDLDLGDNDQGEYVFAYGTCAVAGELEVLRVGYSDVQGDLPPDVPLYVQGSPNDLHGSNLDGAPGYSPCDAGVLLALTPLPWDDSSIDPMQIDGVTHTDGLLILNPSKSVPNGVESFGALKAKY